MRSHHRQLFCVWSIRTVIKGFKEGNWKAKRQKRIKHLTVWRVQLPKEFLTSKAEIKYRELGLSQNY
jgi:hypothetical protein